MNERKRVLVISLIACVIVVAGVLFVLFGHGFEGFGFSELVRRRRVEELGLLSLVSSDFIEFAREYNFSEIGLVVINSTEKPSRIVSIQGYSIPGYYMHLEVSYYIELRSRSVFESPSSLAMTSLNFYLCRGDNGLYDSMMDYLGSINLSLSEPEEFCGGYFYRVNIDHGYEIVLVARDTGDYVGVVGGYEKLVNKIGVDKLVSMVIKGLETMDRGCGWDSMDPELYTMLTVIPREYKSTMIYYVIETDKELLCTTNTTLYFPLVPLKLSAAHYYVVARNYTVDEIKNTISMITSYQVEIEYTIMYSGRRYTLYKIEVRPSS